MLSTDRAVFYRGIGGGRVMTVSVLFTELVLVSKGRKGGNKTLSALFVVLNAMQQGEKDKGNHPQAQDSLAPAFRLTRKEMRC